MKFFLLILSLFSLCFAETLGFVEYEIPQGWELFDKTETDRGTTVIYAPKEDLPEVFGAYFSNEPADLNDLEGIRKGLCKLFPFKFVRLNVIEKDENSLTFEWKVSEAQHDIAYGLSRVFSKEEQTVFFYYYTENTLDKNLWLPLFRHAKILYSGT